MKTIELVHFVGSLNKQLCEVLMYHSVWTWRNDTSLVFRLKLVELRN